MTWMVKMDPMGENGTDGKNQVGVGIFLVNDGQRKEVDRVAFVRRNSINPRTPFQRQLKRSLEKAYAAADTMNAINSGVDDLRKQLDAAEANAQEQIARLLREAEEGRRSHLESLGRSGALA